MNFKVLLLAASMSLAATMGQAITLLDSTDSGNSFDLLADDYQFQEIFTAGDTGDLTFTFDNTSATDAIVTISSASIVQQSNAFFTGGASVSWDGHGAVTAAAEGFGSGGNLSFTLAAGASDTLRLSFGSTVVSPNGAAPDIDFLVSTAPVPVPAGILLMGTALAGFGVMRRRKKAA